MLDAIPSSEPASSCLKYRRLPNITSRSTSRLQLSPNASTAALIGQPERAGSTNSHITSDLVAIYHRMAYCGRTDCKPQADGRRRPMSDTEPQTAGAKVLWHFTMSLDGFVAGPNHEMDWMIGISFRPGLVGEYVETTGAVLGGRNLWDHCPDASGVYGGAWDGPIFVLTHHPEDATPADRVTFLNCDPAEAVRIGLEAAGGKNLEVFSPTIGRQLLELGLIDEIDLHIAPILLGEGIRLYDNPGREPIRLDRVGDCDPTSAVNVRYRPTTTAKIPTERVSG